MSKAVEENENYDDKILMRILFISGVICPSEDYKKNFKWTGFTCLEVMCHYWVVDYFLCHTVTWNTLYSKSSKYTTYNIDIRGDVSLSIRPCKQIKR